MDEALDLLEVALHLRELVVEPGVHRGLGGVVEDVVGIVLIGVVIVVGGVITRVIVLPR